MSLLPFLVLGGVRRASATAATGPEKEEKHALSTSLNYDKG
jgi:hypothetical protein